VKAWVNTWQQLPKEPPQPLVIREFLASPLLPPVKDINRMKLPRRGLASQPVDFMDGIELGDVRGIHGGEDGLIYIEASAKLKQASKGSLAYGSDGPVKVWVNGRVVDCQPTATNPGGVGKYTVHVAWKKGANRITFALATNHGRAWGVQARVV
jgi:hypothetical protein